MPAAAMGPTTIPLLAVALAPAQPSPAAPPLAVQLEALLVDQASVVDWPVLMLLGATMRLSMVAGVAGAGFTVMLTLRGPLGPPGPVQFRVYV